MGSLEKGKRSLRQSSFWPIVHDDRARIRRLLRQPVGLFLNQRRSEALFDFLFGKTKTQKHDEALPEALPPIPLSMNRSKEELIDLSDSLRR